MILKDLSGCTVRDSVTVKNVVNSLTETGLRICLILDSDGKLVGIVSDGDIRRGLLAGKGLDDPVIEVMNTASVNASVSSAPRELEGLARSAGVSHIPLVDDDGVLQGLFLSGTASMALPHPNTVIVMAGGLGTRLRPLTNSIPKPMVHISGKPMIQHLIENLREEGFRNFIVSVNYLADQIEQHFGNGSDYGVEVSYIHESEPLGTAGALSLLDVSFEHPIVVVNADVMLSSRIADMVDFHVAQGSEITVGVKVLETQIPFGVVETQGTDVLAIREKPVHRDLVNAGVYVLQPSVLKTLEKGVPIDMPDVVSSVIGDKSVAAFPIHETWIDLGRLEDLKRAEQVHLGRDE